MMKIFRSTVPTPAGARLPRIALAAAVFATGCASITTATGADSVDRSDPRAACVALEGALSQPITGLAVEGAKVESATLRDFANPPHCSIMGRIAAAEGGGEPRAFELNVPSDWSGHAIQFGDGMRGRRSAADPGDALAAGHAAYGFGGGAGPAAPAAAQKKLRDVATEIFARRFGRYPDKFYFASSEGGGALAVDVAINHPGAFRGLLADATGQQQAQAEAVGAAGSASTADTTSVGLNAFSTRGGKLVILAPAADGASGPPPAVAAYQRVLARLGERHANSYLRLYRLPADSDAAVKADWFRTLIDWAETGRRPGDLPELARKG